MHIQALKIPLGAALLTFCACSSGQAHSPSTQAAPSAESATEPSEQLYVIPPQGWQLSAASNRGNFRRARYLRDPSSEQLESLTFEYLDPDGLADPLSFLESMATEQSDRCSEFSSTAISSGMENGYPSAVRLLSCPRRKINRSSVVSMAKAIQGNSGYYLIVFEKRATARRGAEGWLTDHVSEADIANWALYLRQSIACDPTLPAHPCPDAQASAAEPNVEPSRAP